MIKAETGVMQLQAKDVKARQEPPAAGRGRKESSLESSEGAQSCWHLDFGLLHPEL